MSQREDLLTGAKKCLIEKGYSRTTARDIATASGAHLASIGYHFGSKDRLMNTAVLEATGEWGTLLGSAVQEASGVDPAERFAALVARLLEAIGRHRDLHVAGCQALAQAQFDDDLREAMREGAAEGRRSLAAMMLGKDDTEVTDEEERGIGSVVYALITGYVMQYLIDPRSMPDASLLTTAIGSLTA